MKLVISFSNEHVLFDVAECAPLVAALESARCVDKKGYGSDCQFVANDSTISMEIIGDDRLLPKPELLAILQKEKTAADSRWIEYYNKANSAEKKLQELQDKLKSKGIILADDTPEKEANAGQTF